MAWQKNDARPEAKEFIEIVRKIGQDKKKLAEFSQKPPKK